MTDTRKRVNAEAEFYPNDASAAPSSSADQTERAKHKYDEFMQGDENEHDPLERLRFFCSLAMNGQDWLDVEPFFDDVAALQGEMIAATKDVSAAPQQGSVKDALTPGDFWLKHDDELRYVKRVLEAGREATDADRRKALHTIHALRTIVRAAPQEAPQQEPVTECHKQFNGYCTCSRKACLCDGIGPVSTISAKETK